MKLPRNKRDETSATITPTLWLVAGCSVAFMLTAYATDPSWWSSPGTGSQAAVLTPQVVTNGGVVTTNYVPNDYAVVTQGQLKQFTARAVDYLNAELTNGGAGTNLNTMVSNWAQDYLTNGYNATNIEPSDYTAMTVGQLKYIGNQVWAQLVAGGYTNAVPSWLAQNTNTDNVAANLGQLKEVFNFDLPPPEAPAAVTDLTAYSDLPGEFDLNWALPTTNSANSITVQQSTDGGMTWTTVATLASTATSYVASGLNANSSYSYQVIASNSLGSSSAVLTNPGTPVPMIPPPPTGLVGTIDSSYFMDLSWTASPGATSYLVESENLAAGTWSTLGTTSSLTYQDTNSEFYYTGCHYRVSAINSLGTSAPCEEFPLSRYAVIDLGTNMAAPVKITDSGFVLGLNNYNADLFASATVWHNGQTTNLQPLNSADGWYPFDIGEDGTVVGGESVAYSGCQLAIWSPNATSPTLTPGPVVNESYYDINGNLLQTQVQGMELGLGIAATNSILFTWKSVNSVNLTLGGGNAQWNYIFKNNDEISGLGDSIFFQHNKQGDAFTWISGAVWVYQINNSSVDFQPTGISNRMTIGGQTTTYAVGFDTNFVGVWWDGADHHGTVGLIGGEGGSINAAVATVKDTDGNSVTKPAVQIVSDVFLFEMDPASGQFGSPLLLPSLLPAASGWQDFSSGATLYQLEYLGATTFPATINDSGAIVGTATYTPQGQNDPIAAGSHGVMLLPLQIVRETTPGSGDLEPITDNGLDDNAMIPIFASHTGEGTTETETGGYTMNAVLSTDLSATSTATINVTYTVSVPRGAFLTTGFR